jgi:membrane protein DedA with SNARE-associated domain
MTDIGSLIVRHGYTLLAAIVFAEAIGLPVPAALALIAAGAAIGTHTLSAPLALALSFIAMIAGDLLLFFMGKYSGWGLLGLLCRVSMNPETCILRSAESFYKRGRTTLLFAKFVPGINTMAPPLAGSMRMPLWTFLRFDCAGGVLYVGAYVLLGYVGHNVVNSITQEVETAGHVVGRVLLIAAMAYLVYRFWMFRSHKIYRVAPRVQVQELIEKLAGEEGNAIIVADVRSHGYYDADAARIKGSIRLEPNNLDREVERLPKDKDIYLYCT